MSHETPSITSSLRLASDESRELSKIYDRFSSIPGFPKGFCPPTSDKVAALGFQPKAGWFKTDKPFDPKNQKRAHLWCLDREESIVDLTASQFNTELENPVPEGALIINKEDPLYERYSPITRQSLLGKLRVLLKAIKPKDVIDMI